MTRHRWIALAALAGVAATSPPAPQPAPSQTPAPASTPVAAPSPAPAPLSSPFAALPSFAPALAQQPMIEGPAGWNGVTGAAAWQALKRAAAPDRQPARWRYALGLIAADDGAGATGVLTVMAADDPDLALVPSFQLARAAAMTLEGHGRDAAPILAMAELAANPEACLWRLRALADANMPADALDAVRCALPAVNARTGAARAAVLRIMAGAAVEAGQYRQALAWLAMLPDRDGEANVLRGRALLATGDKADARLRFERARLGGDMLAHLGGELGSIETGLALASIKPADAAKRLEALRYSWRGGPIERRTLEDLLALAEALGDLRGELQAGATLFRYFPLGSGTAPLITKLQAALTAALSPESKMALAEAAGLYWDYRDLAPNGGPGDALALDLANRLQAAGLYARAAELLGYQLDQRAQDVAQGPLSVKVAALQILAGDPQRALDALRGSEQPSYTDAMRWDRKRMEAVALAHLGKKDAALAALDGVPDADAVRAEIDWRAHDWIGFVAATEAHLPRPAGTLGDPERAAVMRHAIALAMLGLEDRLKSLSTRYGKAFDGSTSGPAFALLTQSAGAIDPGKLDAAMASLPTASPPASIGNLLDAGG